MRGEPEARRREPAAYGAPPWTLRPGPHQRERLFLLIVAVTGIVARGIMCWVLVPAWETRAHVPPSPDDYPQLASSLLETGTLGFGARGANPTTVRGPGYALWLSLGIVIGGEGIPWLAFWGSLPAVLAGCTVVWLLLRRYGYVAAIAGSLVGVFHPMPAFISGRVLSDEFTGALGMLGLAAFFACEPSLLRRSVWTLASGLTFALHVLTRSTGLLTLVALLLVIGLMDRSAWRRLAVVLAIALAPAIAWSIRSSRLEGRPVLIQSLVAYNFWIGEGFDRFGSLSSRGESRHLAMELLFDTAGLDNSRLATFWWGQLTPQEAAQVERKLGVAARERIAHDPFGYAGRVLRGLVRYWFAGESAAPSRVYFLTVFPVLVVSAWGASMLVRRARSHHLATTSRGGHGRASVLVTSSYPDLLGLAALVTILLNMLAYAAICPMARYSVQVFPDVAYLAGVGAAGIMTWKRWPLSSRERHRAGHHASQQL